MECRRPRLTRLGSRSNATRLRRRAGAASCEFRLPIPLCSRSRSFAGQWLRKTSRFSRPHGDFWSTGGRLGRGPWFSYRIRRTRSCRFNTSYVYCHTGLRWASSAGRGASGVGVATRTSSLGALRAFSHAQTAVTGTASGTLTPAIVATRTT